MSISANASAWLGPGFDPIGIDALDLKASMLERVDNKYIVGTDTLLGVHDLFARYFDVLEIDGRRRFSYENCYFDGPERQSYFDHHQGRRRRSKVRMRRYVEADLCFIEVKLKERRGGTVKRRLPCKAADFGNLDLKALNYIDGVYRSIYCSTFPYSLSRTLDTLYSRVTLVAKHGGERVTIDGGIGFVAGSRSKFMGDRLFIIETKSVNGNGLADQILRRFHQHPMKRCSKYCAGMILTTDGLKHNNFRPVMRKFAELLDGDAMASSATG